MRGFFSSPPPPPSPLERLRVVLAPFASSSTASFMLRLAVTAYGALLCASLLSARAAFGARKIHDAARATAHLALSSERRRSPCVASARRWESCTTCSSSSGDDSRDDEHAHPMTGRARV